MFPNRSALQHDTLVVVQYTQANGVNLDTLDARQMPTIGCLHPDIDRGHERYIVYKRLVPGGRFLYGAYTSRLQIALSGVSRLQLDGHRLDGYGFLVGGVLQCDTTDTHTHARAAIREREWNNPRKRERERERERERVQLMYMFVS